MKAHQAEESVLDVVDAVGTKVGSFVKEKFGELDKSLNPNHTSTVQDSRDIEALGPMVEELARVFEDTTTMIGKVPYEEQVNLLIGYKKLIEEQIKVIDSRIGMAKRLK
jgi:spermidine synthase